MSVIETAARFIAERGETVTIGRDGEGTRITLKAKRTGAGSLEELGNGAAVMGIVVKIGTAEFAASAWTVKAPKRADDMVMANGFTASVLSVRPILDGDSIGLYALELG